MRNLSYLSLFFLLVVAISSCSPKDGLGPQETQNESTDKNFTEEIDTSVGEYEGETANDLSKDIVGEDASIYWEASSFDKTMTILYDGSSVTIDNNIDGVACHRVNADVAVEVGDIGGVEIVVKGSTGDGQLKIYGSQAIKLTLDGANIISQKSAAINCQTSATLYVHLAEGTTNTLTDASSQSDEAYYPEGVTSSDEKRNGCIYAKKDVVFSGAGSLIVKGNKKHGVSIKKSLYVRPGVTLVVSDAVANSIKADGITIAGGYIWAKTTGEAGKCFSSDADINILGGVLKLYTVGDAIYEEDENDTSSAACIKADANVTIIDGNILCVSIGEGGKGINVDGNLIIEGGKTDVATAGGKYVYNANLDLDSSPKGVKVDGEITINGGALNIQVTGKSDGSEGLESKSKITINGGNLFVYAYDDAINVGGDNPTGIEINGGRIFAFADNNDGIDSNGKMWINGGIVIASGSAAPEEGFDCDNSNDFIVTGGVLVGTGGAAVSTSSSSTQRSVIYNGISATTGNIIAILDADENPVLLYELPRTMNNLALFFSSADIVSQQTYKVYSGGAISGNTENWNGLYFDGTYTIGTQIGSFASTSTTTTVGTGGGPGGEPGNGGHGNGGFGPGWWN